MTKFPLTLVIVGEDYSTISPWIVQMTSLNEIIEDVIVVANTDGKGLAEIGNFYLDRSLSSKVMGLVHADVSFGEGSLETFTSVAMDGKVCGIVGRSIEGDYRWGKFPMGHCEGTSPFRSVGPGPVSTLDGCAVFVRKDLGMRFDSVTFDGMHCHVEDLCLQAQIKGIEVIVPMADASHVGESTGSPGWMADYWRYRHRLTGKWLGKLAFETT